MFNTARIFGGAMLACTLLLCSAAQAEEGIHLLVPPKVGQSARMKLYMKVDLGGMKFVSEGVSREVVKEVKENGDVVLESTEEGSTVTAGGVTQKAPTNPPSTSTRDKFGKTLVPGREPTGGLTTPEVDKLMMQITDVILTDKALQVNDTWETAIDNPAVPEKKITLKDTYLGLEKIEGKDYWKIKQTTEAVANAKGDKVTYELQEWIDPATGIPYKFSGTIQGVPTQQGIMNIQLNARLLKPDEQIAPKAGKAEKKDN